MIKSLIVSRKLEANYSSYFEISYSFAYADIWEFKCSYLILHTFNMLYINNTMDGPINEYIYMYIYILHT